MRLIKFHTVLLLVSCVKLSYEAVINVEDDDKANLSKTRKIDRQRRETRSYSYSRQWGSSSGMTDAVPNYGNNPFLRGVFNNRMPNGHSSWTNQPMSSHYVEGPVETRSSYYSGSYTSGSSHNGEPYNTHTTYYSGSYPPTGSSFHGEPVSVRQIYSGNDPSLRLSYNGEPSESRLTYYPGTYPLTGSLNNGENDPWNNPSEGSSYNMEPDVSRPVYNPSRGSSNNPNTIRGRIPISETSSEEVMECGKRKLTNIGLIRQGGVTKEGDWPWHVAVFMKKTASSQPVYICGGSLVSETNVITAGHCVTEKNAVVLPDRMVAHLGQYYLYDHSANIQEKNIFEIKRHPNYNESTLQNDLAILKLATKAVFNDYVQPICVWGRSNTERSAMFGTLGTLVGWGFDEDNSPSNILKVVKYPIISDMTCMKKDAVFFELYHDENKVCAGFANGTSACNGDSGSGLFYSFTDSNKSQKWYLRGIVSSTKPNQSNRQICDSNHYTLLIDIAQYNDFIEEKI